jgi:hypothetical protein
LLWSLPHDNNTENYPRNRGARQPAQRASNVSDMGTTMDRPIQAASGVITLLVCAIAMLSAAVAIPYWFGQAFGYSAAVGRTEIGAEVATAMFQCRADIVFRAASLLALCSLLARTLHLHVARHYGWKLGLGRSCIEHVALGLASWGLVALTGLPASIGPLVESFANRFCQ